MRVLLVAVAMLLAAPLNARVLEGVQVDNLLIEVADYNKPTQFELYVTHVSAPTIHRRISHPISGQGWDVNPGVVVVEGPHGWRVAYVLTQVAYGTSDLYTVDVTGSEERLISRLAVGGFVRFGVDHLTYGAQVIAGGPTSWRLTDSMGAMQFPVVFADGFETGNKRRWR